MGFETLCDLKDLRPGSSASFVCEGREILLLWPYEGELKAFQGTCPHQDVSLAYALFDGAKVTCQLHRWSFNASTGQGIGPNFSRLAEYALRIEDGVIQVDVMTKVSA